MRMDRATVRGGSVMLLASAFLHAPAMLGAVAGAAAPSTWVLVQQEVPAGPEFSARVIWRSDGDTKDGLLYVKGDRYRLEPRGGVKTDLGYAGVQIVREDQREVWYVLSQRRSYVAIPFSPSQKLPISVKLEGEISRTFIGDALSGGRSAKLFEVVVDRYGRRETYFQWVDAERDFLLKLLSKHRDWSVEYQHVVISKQPSYYFEVPRGYRRIEAGTEPDADK